jgi:hypothetical protein
MNKSASFLVLAASIVLLIGCSGESQSPSSPTEKQAQTGERTKPTLIRPKFEDSDFSNSKNALKAGAFGLPFGITKDEVEKTDVTWVKTAADGNFSWGEVKSAPRPWADAETYTLIFVDGRLLKISAVGKSVTDDLLGTEGKGKFKDLKESLVEKYGKPTSSGQSTGHALWNEPNEFYQCLNHAGCGAWFAAWQLPDRTILLQLKGEGRGQGFITLQYESQPEWGAAIDKKDAAKNKQTKEGL